MMNMLLVLTIVPALFAGVGRVKRSGCCFLTSHCCFYFCCQLMFLLTFVHAFINLVLADSCNLLVCVYFKCVS